MKLKRRLNSPSKSFLFSKGETDEQMNRCDRLTLKILDTMIELNDYSDVEEVAKWLHCGTEKHLSLDELKILKADVLEHGADPKYSIKALKKKLSDYRFMLRVGKAVHRCREWHEFGIDIPFRFFMLPDYIAGKVYLGAKKLKNALTLGGNQS